MFDKDLFLSLCKKYDVELSATAVSPMIKKCGGLYTFHTYVHSEESAFFSLENQLLFLDKVFVSSDNFFSFFACIDNTGNRYLCECTDIENDSYIVVKTSIGTIIDMLKGKITMRESLMNADSYLEIIAGEDISEDVVEKKNIKMIDKSVLPDKNAYFKMVTDDLHSYCSKLQAEYESESEWSFALEDTYLYNDDNISIQIDDDNNKNMSFIKRLETIVISVKKMTFALDKPFLQVKDININKNACNNFEKSSYELNYGKLENKDYNFFINDDLDSYNLAA